MPIPLATTTVTVTGLRGDDRKYDPLSEGYPGSAPAPTPATIVTGLRACISLPKVDRYQRPSGDDGAESDKRAFLSDWAALEPGDTVLDEQSGVSYELVWVTYSDTQLFGLDHMDGELRVLTLGVP